MAKGKILERKVGFYARSILDIARADNKVDRVEGEFKVLKDEVVSNLDLKRYLTDPSIEQSERIKTGLKVLGKSATPVIKAVMAMIITLDIVENIEQIYEGFVGLVSQFKKQVYVEVVSTVELDDGMMKKIKAEVDKKNDFDVRIRNTVDKSIIGGMVIKIGERIIDLSIKKEIDEMRNKLKSIELRGEEFGSENKFK